MTANPQGVFLGWGASTELRTSGPGCEFSDDGVKKIGADFLGNAEMSFQRLDKIHQLLHFRNDPTLFGDGWQGDGATAHLAHVD